MSMWWMVLVSAVLGAVAGTTVLIVVLFVAFGGSDALLYPDVGALVGVAVSGAALRWPGRRT